MHTIHGIYVFRERVGGSTCTAARHITDRTAVQMAVKTAAKTAHWWTAQMDLLTADQWVRMKVAKKADQTVDQTVDQTAELNVFSKKPNERPNVVVIVARLD